MENKNNSKRARCPLCGDDLGHTDLCPDNPVNHQKAGQKDACPKCQGRGYYLVKTTMPDIPARRVCECSEKVDKMHAILRKPLIFPQPEKALRKGEEEKPVYQIEHTSGWSDLRPDEVELYKNSNANVRLKPQPEKTEQTAEGIRTAKEIIQEDGDRHENSWEGWYYSEDSVVDAMETYASQHLSQYKEGLINELENLNSYGKVWVIDVIDLIQKYNGK